MRPFLRHLLPLALLLPLQGHANLTVHPMRTSVDAGRGAQIRVYSQSPQPQYVQASLRRIVDPAGMDEQEVEVEPGEAAIAVTPGKFALAGGGNRLVRLVPLHPVQQETAYRVYFEGVRGPEEAAADADDAARASVGVSLVWGALVNVLPADGQVRLQLRGDVLHNTGTLRLGITSVAVCSANGSCTAHDISRSLYPGSTLRLPFVVTPNHTVQLRYRLTRGGHREHVQTLAP